MKVTFRGGGAAVTPTTTRLQVALYGVWLYGVYVTVP